MTGWLPERTPHSCVQYSSARCLSIPLSNGYSTGREYICIQILSGRLHATIKFTFVRDTTNSLECKSLIIAPACHTLCTTTTSRCGSYLVKASGEALYNHPDMFSDVRTHGWLYSPGTLWIALRSTRVVSLASNTLTQNHVIVTSPLYCMRCGPQNTSDFFSQLKIMYTLHTHSGRAHKFEAINSSGQSQCTLWCNMLTATQITMLCSRPLLCVSKIWMKYEYMRGQKMGIDRIFLFRTSSCEAAMSHSYIHARAP